MAANASQATSHCRARAQRTASRQEAEDQAKAEGAPEATLRAMRGHRENFLAELRRRWEDGTSEETQPR